MKKRLLSIMLSLCLILTAFTAVPVYAAGSVSLDKTAYTAGEPAKITVSGVSQQQMEDGAYLSVGGQGERTENASLEVYVSDLPASNIYEYNVPTDLGAYVVYLMDSSDNVLASTTFTVGSPKAKAGDIALSKSEAKLNEPMSVTFKGLTNEQIENDAWFGIVKWNEKLENTTLDGYIVNLPADNTYKFNAPQSFGKYQVRVFSSSETTEDVLFGTAEFLVVSSKAQTGDILLSKTSVAPEEKMSVTVKGLTKGEIDTDAWIGIELSNEKLENTTVDAYISQLPVGDKYEFTAPSEPGTYEVRVFCAGNLKDEEYEYGKFGTAQFVVSGAAAENTDYTAGYEGLAPWAAPVVNEAVDANLTTQKVLVDFPSPITREQFCELAVLLYEKMTGTKAVLPASNPFNDTTNPEILKAANLGIVGGVGNGKFAPNNNVTRQEISVMLLRTLKCVMPDIPTSAEFKTKFQDAGSVDAWALEAVKFMNANDVVGGSTVNGVSYILPKGNTTREQAIALVLRIYNKFNKL